MAAPTALGVVCLALCARSFARNADWFDDRSSGRAPSARLRAVTKSTSTSHFWRWKNQTDRKRPRGEIERAIAILQPLPDDEKVPSLYATAGFCYRVKGNALGQNGGAAWYRKSLDVLLEGRRLDQAEYREMVRQNSLRGMTLSLAGEPAIYMELGRTYRRMGEPKQAIEAFDYVRSINPRAEFFEEMAAAYRTMRDPAAAAVTLLEGITMGEGDRSRLAADTVNLYGQTAPESCALAGSGSSTTLNLNCPLVRNELCTAGRNAAALYRRMGRESDAIATASSSVRSLGCPSDMFQ